MNSAPKIPSVNFKPDKLVSESKKLDVACIDVHGNAVPIIIKIAQKIEIDFLFIIKKFSLPFNSQMVDSIKKESVELFVYLTGGSDKTRIQINNTPHLNSIYPNDT